MATIFEIEEEEVEAALTSRVNNIEISTDDNRSINSDAYAENTVNTASANATASTILTTNENDTRLRDRYDNSSLQSNQITVATNAMATTTAPESSANATASTNTTTTKTKTGQPQSKTNTNRKGI